MRDYGKVVSTFWTRGSGKQLRGDKAAQVLALHLFTSPGSTMTGLYYLTVPSLSHETGLTLDEISAAFGKLAALDIAHYDADAELVWVPEMARYQIDEKLDPKDRRVKGVEREISAFKGHRFFDAFVARYREPFGLVTKGLGSPLQGVAPSSKAPCEPLVSQDQDQDQDQDQEHAQDPEARAVASVGSPDAGPAAPSADLFVVASRLAAAGDDFGAKMLWKLTNLETLTAPQRATLRDIDRRLTAAGPRSAPVDPAGAELVRKLYGARWTRWAKGAAYSCPDADLGPAGKIWTEATKRAVALAVEAKGAPAPSAEDIAAHWLDRHFAEPDKKLEDGGRPIGLVVYRCGTYGLPTVRKPRPVARATADLHDAPRPAIDFAALAAAQGAGNGGAGGIVARPQHGPTS